MTNFRKKQKGFIMIQVLLGLAVLIAIMTGWAYYQNREHQKAVATRITNEINYILQAATSYYIENKQWPKEISVLVDKGYLLDKNKTNPYGNQYEIGINSDNEQEQLVLTTDIPSQYDYVSRTAMGALPFAELPHSEDHGTLTVTINSPGNSKIVLTDKRIVSPGTPEAIIEKPECSGKQYPAIYTSIASCGDATGNSIGACRAYARDGAISSKGKPAWQVKVEVLTEGGWIDGEVSPSSKDLNKVEVSTVCQIANIKP